MRLDWSYAENVVRVTLTASIELEPGWRLVVTAQPLHSEEVIEQLGTYHVLAPSVPERLAAGARWTSSPLVPGIPLRHANDGPVSAYVVAVDGSVLPVRIDLPVAEPSARVVTPTFAGEPAFAWRGMHFDVARQWFEPADVHRVIDLVASRRLNRLHLHLTDDEGWRLPVDGYPQLRDAATRGHGLVISPMLGSGSAPYGRLYTRDEIAELVAHADRVGVVLVPEVDMPAHMHAALAAIPELRDPAAPRGSTVSIQGFPDNVLPVGHPPADEFVDAVIDTVVELFPTSPWIHIGGDEVPEGAPPSAPFLRRVVERIRAAGRQVVAWQEVAECGALSPEDGYVMAWQRAGGGRRLAEAGHDVVLAPASAYYFDMAQDDAWEEPGGSWAGTVTLDRVAEFEPGRGWSADARRHLVGVQASLWTEHVRSWATLQHLLLPRLDAFAHRAWTNTPPTIT